MLKFRGVISTQCLALSTPCWDLVTTEKLSAASRKFRMVLLSLELLWSRDEQGKVFINWELCYHFIMQLIHKLLLNLALAVSLLVVLYALFTSNKVEPTLADLVSHHSSPPVMANGTADRLQHDHDALNRSVVVKHLQRNTPTASDIHIWCILTNVDKHSHLKKKFSTFLESLLDLTTRDLNLHVICDESGRRFAEESLNNTNDMITNYVKMYFYDMAWMAEQLKSLIAAMQPHFSSSPGSYYSDALFFLSLGLHKVAPPWMTHSIMIDVDTQFQTDPALLWAQFDKFTSMQLVALAPELSPVYRHTLFSYRASLQGGTKVGEPHLEGGYSGLNSGVILLRLDRLRKSKIFYDLCEANTVTSLAKKYSFKGHLGDQDFYTLLGIERPELIRILPCTWNRQLCTWWQDHGYAHVFHRFFACEGNINLYHGNCNTPIPYE